MDFLCWSWFWRRPAVPEPEVIVLPDIDQVNDSIFQFAKPPNPTAEIVFFHDINWAKYKYPHLQTWMSDNELPVCWPMKWLSRKYPDARIISVRYDSSVLKTSTEGHMRLSIVAENVREDILHCYDSGCPLFLVGHGFGSMVIKKLLRSMQDRHDQERLRQQAAGNHGLDDRHLAKLNSFLKNVKGVFFFAPPSHGSKVTEFTRESSRGSLIAALQLLDADGAELNAWFGSWRETRHCRATAICAAHPTTVDLPDRKRSIHVADEASIRSDVDSVYTTGTNHFNVCRLRGVSDSSFHRLQELIDSWKQQPIVDGIVGWWKMEEGSGNTCRDFSGRNAHGTHTTAVRWGIGNYPRTGCLVFEGHGGVACGTAASISGPTPFSVSAWVKVPPDCERATIIQQRGPRENNGEYQLRVDRDGKPGFWIWGTRGSLGESCSYEEASQFSDRVADDLTGTVVIDTDQVVRVLYANRSINDDRWHHVVAIRDGKAGHIYIDSTLCASTIGSSVKVLNVITPISVFIGFDGFDNKEYFKGSIGEVRIYTRALSENEIRSLQV